VAVPSKAPSILALALLRHGVPIVAHFDWALAVTLAAPAASLEPLVAPGLALDTVGAYGFLAALCVQTYRLRPRGLPSWLGINFLLVAYRVFVRADRAGGARGLQILSSETNRSIMAIGGGLFTHYGYRKVRARVERAGRMLHVETSSGFDVTVNDEAPPLPAVFADWNEAQRYAGPMPFTFASIGGRAVVSIEGTRMPWEPRPVAVTGAVIPFFARLVPEAQPVSAFLVEDVRYEWKRGRVQPLRP
jgi:uncharacterized protein DUF2071